MIFGANRLQLGLELDHRMLRQCNECVLSTLCIVQPSRRYFPTTNRIRPPGLCPAESALRPSGHKGETPLWE
jgi:hypothetical protein